MPDTGAAAGQQVEASVRLRRYGVALSYANAAAFELAGWLLSWRVAQAAVALSYTLVPHPVATKAALGWHVIVLTLVNGEGDLLIAKPAGSGWTSSPADGWRTRCESTDNDDVYNAIQQGVGVATEADLVTVVDYLVTDDDSFMRVFAADNAALALFGYDSSDLNDGPPSTLTLEGSLRKADNSAGIPDAWLAVTVVTADDGEDPVLRISWGDYPSAVASVQLGLDFPSTDVTDDALQPSVVYLWQVRYLGTQTFAVTAISTGLNGTFTIAGDRRQWFAKGGSFTKTATGTAVWVVSSVSYSGGNTIITVTGTIISGVVDGNLTVAIKRTLGKGTITTESRQVRP